MRVTRRALLRQVAPALALLVAVRPVLAAAPITIVVPYPPGGASDHVARLIAPGLAKSLGEAVEVVNEPGDSANRGLIEVAASSADGRTLALVTSQHAINATLFEAPGYDLYQDLAPVAGLSAMPLVLAVNPQLPAASVDELIALAEARPGRLRFASSGIGGSPHLAAAEFNTLADTEMSHLPFDGSGPAVAAVMAGAADLLFDTTVAALPAVRDGRLRGLAVTSAARSPAAPDLPTLTEAGLPGLEVLSWNGLMVPAGTPAAEVERLHTAVVQAMSRPEIQAELASLGAAIHVTTPEEFGTALADDIAAWSRIVRAAGLAGSA